MSKSIASVLLLVAAVSAQTWRPPTDHTTRPPPEWNWWNEISEGHVSVNSRLIFNGTIAGPDFEWTGPNLISAFRISGLNNTRQLETRGGVHTNVLQAWSNHGPVSGGRVLIYSEPLNQTIGWNHGDVVVVRE